jgi:KDO2-lipid IV(A) lauroyltransferase
MPNAKVHLRENLGTALGRQDATPSEDELDRYVARAFDSYGRYWAEGAKLPALDETTRARRFVISEGSEHLFAAKAEGRGIIIALPHIGSWEWGGSYLAHVDLKMTAVAEALEPAELFEWFRDKRRAIGIDIEPLDDGAGTALLGVLRAGGVVGLLCDRDIQSNGIEVEFFGRPATMPAGPATLALRTGALLVAAACYSGPGDGHHAAVSDPIDTTRTGRLRQDVTRCTQLVANELEMLIRRAPEQWHMLQPIFADRGR